MSSILQQKFVQNDVSIANDLIQTGTLIEFQPGQQLIVQDDGSNDVFLLVAGTVSIAVNGVEVRTLFSGSHVGEMSAIHPANPRSATVTAVTTVVAVRVSSPQFIETCDKHSGTWKFISQELSHRLFDRNKLIKIPNEKPKLFIISSVEAISVANEIQSGLQHDCLPTVWTNGVFWAGGYPLEALEKAAGECDFGVAVAKFEDVVSTRDGEHKAMRDNVLFELGMFIGELGRHRTVLVHPKLKDLVLPSDLQGIVPASYIVPDKDSDLPSRLGPVCNEIRKLIKQYGPRNHAG